MSEFRSSPRFDCDIMLNKVQDGHMHVCRATNISLGGIRVQKLLEPLAKRPARVRLQVVLPGQERPIWLGVRPVYEDEGFVGYSFTHVSHQHYVLLRDWLQLGDVVESAA